MAPSRKRHRRPPRRQLNAEVDDVLRAEMRLLGRVVGDPDGAVLPHGGVMRVLLDAFLGRRPSASPAERAFFDALLRQWREAARRAKRGLPDD